MNSVPVLITGIMLVMLSCRKHESDEPPTAPVNEEELITTVRMHFTPDGGGDTTTLSFTDLDGDGGNAPVIIGDTLMGSATYDAWLELFNELTGDTITHEIEEDAEAHQFFFQENGGTLAFVSYDDADANGHPIGLRSTWQSSGVTDGTITILLRHEPDKSAPGVSDGDITNAGGETDIEVTLPYRVE